MLIDPRVDGLRRPTEHVKVNGNRQSMTMCLVMRSQPGAPRKRKASAGQKTPVLKRKSQLLSDSSDHNQHFISELTLFSLNRQLWVGLWTSDRIRRWSVKFCPNEEKIWPKSGDPFFFFALLLFS